MVSESSGRPRGRIRSVLTWRLVTVLANKSTVPEASAAALKVNEVPVELNSLTLVSARIPLPLIREPTESPTVEAFTVVDEPVTTAPLSVLRLPVPTTTLLPTSTQYSEESVTLVSGSSLVVPEETVVCTAVTVPLDNLYQRYVNGAVPCTPTLKRTASPELTVCVEGCVMMEGGAFTVTTAGRLVAAFSALPTITS